MYLSAIIAGIKKVDSAAQIAETVQSSDDVRNIFRARAAARAKAREAAKYCTG